MAESSLVITQVRDVVAVDFRSASILDGSAVEAIRNELYNLIDAKDKRKVILDFTHVQFLCSMMLGVLLEVHKKSKAIKGKLVLCGLRPNLLQVFKIMKLDKVMSFAENEEQALGLFDASARG